MKSDKKNKEPFSNAAFGALTAAVLAATAFAGYLFMDSTPRIEPFPTPEELQEDLGREVYVLPDGRVLKRVSDYCILIASEPSHKQDRLGENPLEGVCSAAIAHDMDFETYSVGELADLCELANGEVEVVASVSGNGLDGASARFACASDKLIG